MSIFTLDEQTKKKYTVKDVIAAARFILTEKRVTTINTDSVKDISDDSLFTLVELNNMSTKIVRDTYAPGFFR